MTYQHLVIFKGVLCIGWKSFVVERNLKWSYVPVWEDSHPYQIAMCCFLYLALLPKTALALRGNYFSILESYKISGATAWRGIQSPTSTVLMRLFHSTDWTNIIACRTPGSLAWGEFPLFWRAISTSEKILPLLFKIKKKIF